MKAVKQKGHKTLGILAGRGELPYIAARNALDNGERVVLFTFTDQKVPDDLYPYHQPIILTRLYSSFFRNMKRMNVDRLLLLGKATRDILFNKPKFDLRTLYLLIRLTSQSDFTLFEAIAAQIEKLGISILPQTIYLQNLKLPIGRYGKKLDSREIKDSIFALEHAKLLNKFDIGQTVVVGNLSVLALEAAEGTDLCIKRGGNLFNKKGAIICKLPKKNHDPRFDIPAIGETTLQSMKDSGCRVLVFDHSGAIVIDPPKVLAFAGKNNITLLSINMNIDNVKNHIKQINKSQIRYKGK